ncbi:MAG: ABC transporter substrate-binding protein [Acidobacteriota bacterium]
MKPCSAVRPASDSKTSTPALSPRSSAALSSLLLAVSLVALGCGSDRDDAKEDRQSLATQAEKIVVAVAWPWEARSELLFSQGIDMALEEVNAAGGIDGRELSVLRVDDHESVNEGRLAAQRLSDNPEVMAVIGHLQSHVTVPAAAIYDAGGLLLVSPAATNADLTEQGYSRVFRACFVDHDVGTQMGDYAKAQGYKRVAIYYVRSIYGQALASAFESRIAEIGGVNVVARDAHGAEQDVAGGSLLPLFSRWTQLSVDAIFLAGEVPSAGRIIAEIRQAGLEMPVFGGDAMSSPALIQVGGEAVEGTVVATFFHPSEPRPEVAAFVEAFAARFDTPPDVAAALGYDALHLLAEAMRQAPTPAPEDVAQALRALDAWSGVTGPFTFDAEGDLVGRAVPKVVVESGEFIYLPEAAASADG